MIVYAENANKAKAEGARCTDRKYTDIRVRRVPWADKYGSFDNIPPKVFIDNGWWMFCCKCSGKRADLQYTNLTNVDLHGVELSHADLCGVNLDGAYLPLVSLQ